MAALFMGGATSASGQTVGMIGVALFATTTLFTLITLPIEFDASKRALATSNGPMLPPWGRAMSVAAMA